MRAYTRTPAHLHIHPYALYGVCDAVGLSTYKNLGFRIVLVNIISQCCWLPNPFSFFSARVIYFIFTHDLRTSTAVYLFLYSRLSIYDHTLVIVVQV